AHKPMGVLEAPSILGLFPKGVETLPDALLAAGLAKQLGAQRAGRVEPPAYIPERDPETLLLNPRGLADYAVALADAIGRLLNGAMLPVVLGGDCSIVFGVPPRAQASRPLRPSFSRWPRRLLPARRRTERRGGLYGSGACHGSRAVGGHEHRGTPAAGTRRGCCRSWTPRRGGCGRAR